MDPAAGVTGVTEPREYWGCKGGKGGYEYATASTIYDSRSAEQKGHHRLHLESSANLSNGFGRSDALILLAVVGCAGFHQPGHLPQDIDLLNICVKMLKKYVKAIDW